MPSWNEIRKEVEAKGFTFFRHGKEHDAYINKETGKLIWLERHWNKEVRKGLLKKLRKDIGD